jgi:mannose/fructose/N-acetylgalactosamine-specific phosphotransferase system component IIC
MESWRTQRSAREDPKIMKKLGIALLAVAFALPTFVVAQEPKKEEPTTTEKKKKKKSTKKKKTEKKKEEAKPPAR